jgi:hypothetical protein
LRKFYGRNPCFMTPVIILYHTPLPYMPNIPKAGELGVQVPQDAWHPVVQWASVMPQKLFDEQHCVSGHFRLTAEPHEPPGGATPAAAPAAADAAAEATAGGAAEAAAGAAAAAQQQVAVIAAAAEAVCHTMEVDACSAV